LATGGRAGVPRRGCQSSGETVPQRSKTPEEHKHKKKEREKRLFPNMQQSSNLSEEKSKARGGGIEEEGSRVERVSMKRKNPQFSDGRKFPNPAKKTGLG